MSNKRDSIGTKGTALALILCVAAAGLTGYLYYVNSGNTQEAEAILEEPAEWEDAPVFAEQNPGIPSAAEPTAAGQTALQTASPVIGDTIGDYAMDCLSYNETTRDWRTHNGIDLAAEPGSPVGAAAEGTVYTAYEDDTMGYTVVIRHPGGYTTRYSSLSENLCVQPGDTVALGQTIGYAGESALVETVMGSHVHFGVTYQDTPMDPAEFLALS